MPVGTTSGPYSNALSPNATTAEFLGAAFAITPTGFNIQTSIAGATYIYIAIRRGPMKTPTTATSVFIPFQGNGNGGVGETVTTNFPVDLSVNAAVPPNTNYGAAWTDRLRGSGSTNSPELLSSSTAAQNNQAPTYYIGMDSNTTLFNKSYGSLGKFVNWAFRRAPSFFDEVCYTGNGAARTITHNLTVAPELIIIKARTIGATTPPDWTVRAVGLGNTSTLFLNLTDAAVNYMSYVWNNANPTSTGFQLSVDNYLTNSSTGSTYVAYLFATCPGVSKVGSYTGTGTLTTINCGFSGGARYVLIKRSDSTSDWFVWDTARGMVSGTDPSLSWNTTAAQVNANSVYTITTGFQLLASPSADVNTNGGTYIYLAIA
jgi:hypothetical protein